MCLGAGDCVGNRTRLKVGGLAQQGIRFGYRDLLWVDHDDKTEEDISKPREALYRDRYLPMRAPLIILASRNVATRVASQTW